MTQGDWTEADLSRVLGNGVETAVSRALAPLCVIALSADAEARGVDWDGSWKDAFDLGMRLRAVIDNGLSTLTQP